MYNLHYDDESGYLFGVMRKHKGGGCVQIFPRLVFTVRMPLYAVSISNQEADKFLKIIYQVRI